ASDRAVVSMAHPEPRAGRNGSPTVRDRCASASEAGVAHRSGGFERRHPPANASEQQCDSARVSQTSLGGTNWAASKRRLKKFPSARGGKTTKICTSTRNE